MNGKSSFYFARVLGGLCIRRFWQQSPQNTRGNDIDKCDTVFRMSVLPLSPYKEIAGEKNTFVFVRDKRLRKFNYEFRDEDLYGFRASDLENHQKPKALIYDGYPRNLTAGWSLISFEVT